MLKYRAGSIRNADARLDQALDRIEKLEARLATEQQETARVKESVADTPQTA